MMAPEMVVVVVQECPCLTLTLSNSRIHTCIAVWERISQAPPLLPEAAATWSWGYPFGIAF